MKTRTSLLGGAALGALAAFALTSTASAATHHRHHTTTVRVVTDPTVKSEVEELKAEVDALKAQQDQQTQSTAATQAQVQQLQGQLQQANARADQAEAQVQAQIQTIPTQVDEDVAKHAPHTDKLYYKGVTITLGGFAAAESVYRSRNDVADIGSQYQKIPYDNAALAHTDESRFTARQSRISFLAQGNPTPDLTASFYGEFDFLAGPQTANYNESNSFSPRIRNVYGALDTTSGWHLLVGQNWSLATMNGKGISARNEVIPATIEAQYVPGFVWARQPQIRLVHDFDDKQLWVAASLENPQTTFSSVPTGLSGNGQTFGGVTVTDASACLSQCDSANSPSFNHMPDVIGKVAFEPIIGGAQPLHLEVYGLLRQYYDRVNINATAGSQAALAGLTTGNFTDNNWGGGVGGGFTWTAVPKLLDLQGSVLTGRGIGRYGAGQLPDVVVGPGGNLMPIQETMFLAGATVHATGQLDIYAYGGEERENAAQTNTTLGGSAVHLGYGNQFATLGNCFVELGTCTTDTQRIDQLTVGFWDKAFTGNFGQVRIGVQFSHTWLTAFPGLAGTNSAGFAPGSTVRPSTGDNMVFTSFRYYPF